MDLPYRAEYAKSGRASCRGCKSIILKGDLRLAAMIQSPAFDGRVPHWYHFDCFFVKQRPTTEDDIAHFESLRWEDQEKIKKQISTLSSIVVPAKKGKKRNAGASLPSQSALIDYFIQYAKSGRSSCRGCEQTIMKDEIRVSKRDFQTDIGKRYGGQDMWHHLTCFAKLRSELGYFECGDSIPGFKTLSIEDQAQVKIELPAIKQETIPEKKIKLEDETDGKSQEKEMKEQNKIMYKYRDQLKELSKSELQKLFDKNNQEIPVGTDRMLDRLSDGMAFGALEKCSTCKEGQLVFNKFGYQCGGNLTEWSKCEIIVKTPKRNRFKIPKELTEKYPFLKKYKYVPRTRIIKDVNPSSSTAVKKEETYTGPKIIRELPPLYNMEFVILLKKRPELKSKITKLGGKISTKVKETVMAVIATANDVDKMGSRITEAMNADVHVVTEDILDEAKEYSGRIPELILKKNICTWGSDPYTRMPEEPSSSKSKSKSTSIFTKSLKSKVKVTVKGGAAVDPDSGLDDVAHIFQEDNVRYTAVLGLTDIQQQKNSYYKLQLLEADSGNKYWLFRAWGRIGTTIGNTKVEKLNLMTAIEEFRRLYEEKTGNMWENRQNFVKVPNRMYPIEINFGDEAEATVNINSDIPTKLPKSIQELIQLIFDVNKMKNLMLEFELDTEKMPLGKLSKAQIQSAYEVLSELQQLVNIQAPSVRFVDASNRFYTFIPHSFGVDNPPIIDSSEMIKKKIEMLDNLMELEVAYNLMKSTGGDNSLDSYYDKLKTEIDILHHESEEFNIIKDYVKNTHAETHSNYELEIQDVFTVKRQGEDKRFKPFRKLNNRKLLWHGSRTTNYAGILSQGLRIAPPEAPVTGYMFGKGIYFADMVSKSANYCCTTPSSNTGLLLLCEVALGEIHELYNAKYIEKLPKGKHSVKGIGKTEPDPSKLIKIANDVEVPIGKGVSLQRSKATSLLYNEYIVYDTAQVNIKYLLKMNFKYKY